MTDLYLWFKALHVISIIAWMAGLLYLPRLFIYHTAVAIGSDQSALFKVMERRLYRYIMRPAMISSTIFGAAMLATPGAVDWSSGWLHGKLLLVLLLFGAHGAMGRWLKDFEADRNQKSTRYYRIANEVPTLIMIGIVILVVVKPF